MKKPDFSHLKDDHFRKVMENIDFDKFADSFIEKLKREEKESADYFNDGSFKKDLEKIRSYLEKNDCFSFEGNAYHNYISFINEKYLIRNITDVVTVSNEDEHGIFDDQEYDIEYEDLRFNFIHGLGTIITVSKKGE